MACSRVARSRELLFVLWRSVLRKHDALICALDSPVSVLLLYFRSCIDYSVHDSVPGIAVANTKGRSYLELLSK